MLDFRLEKDDSELKKSERDIEDNYVTTILFLICFDY